MSTRFPLHRSCGRCGSADLLPIPCTPGDHSRIVLGNRQLTNVQVCKYVCTDCGCIEEWANSREDLAKLKEALHRERLDVQTER